MWNDIKNFFSALTPFLILAMIAGMCEIFWGLFFSERVAYWLGIASAVALWLPFMIFAVRLRMEEISKELDTRIAELKSDIEKAKDECGIPQ